MTKPRRIDLLGGARSLARWARARGVHRRSRAGLASLLALLGMAPSCHKPEPVDPEALALAQRMIPGKASRPGMSYELPYQLYVPRGYDRARRYPLIVFLHPTGGNGTDNLEQLGPPVAALMGRAQDIEPAFVLVPQCPEGDKWVSRVKGPPFLNYSQKERPQSVAARLVLAALDDLQAKYSIDADRIYLTGASAGGAGTWDLVTRNGVGRFAAAVPITGANDPSRAPAIATLPIWAFHGANDDLSPVTNTREMVGALRKLGSPVKYTEYAREGHACWDRAYAENDLFPWLFAQRRGPH
jgi:predicted peptidase